MYTVYGTKTSVSRQMADEPTTECVMCNNAARLQCSRCSSQWYCGKKCQKEDWRIHKLLCSERQKFETRPNENVRRAIVFEEDEPTVKFIWVSVEHKDSSYSDGYEHACLEKYFGPGENGWSQVYYSNVRRSRSLREKIDLRHRELFLTDGSKPNKAVAATAGATTGEIWSGPLVALKYVDTGDFGMLSFYTDMDMRDFRDVVDYLLTYGHGKPEEEQQPPKALAPIIRGISALSLTLRGVRINCLGDTTKSGRKKFESVELSIDRQKDRLFIPPIPARVGILLELKKLPPPSSWKYDSYLLQNPSVTFLNLDIDPSSSRWGWAPMEWDDMIGSVVVVRTDGKDLFPQHVEALDYYCRYVLQPLFGDSMGGGMNPESKIGKEEVMYRMSPKCFELFYSGFMDYKHDTDSQWGAGVPYPDIVGSDAKVKGLRENFHKLNPFL